jgi:hypothetical protein
VLFSSDNDVPRWVEKGFASKKAPHAIFIENGSFSLYGTPSGLYGEKNYSLKTIVLRDVKIDAGEKGSAILPELHVPASGFAIEKIAPKHNVK